MIRSAPLPYQRWQSDRPAGESFFTARRLAILLFLLLLTALALFHLWQSWQWIYWLNQLHQAEVQLKELQAERDRLKFELAQAFSLERLERIATQKLGLVRPHLKYLVIPPLEP